jgi:hypothetical protein
VGAAEQVRKKTFGFLSAVQHGSLIDDLTPTGNTPLSSPSQVALETWRKATIRERQA